jgi:hypothetical protein
MKGIVITPLDALNKLPIAVKGSIIFFFIFTLVVFASISVLLSGGGTQIIDGQYFLTNKGIIIRAITEVEFIKFQFLELRMSSILFLLFNYINTISYFYIFKKNHCDQCISHLTSKTD